MTEFKQDIRLDSAMLKAGMNEGLNGVLSTAMLLGVSSPDEAIARAEWFKKQPKKYKDKVIAKVIEMERP